jgi:uncharacterized protein YebE (UPF0316 family)
MKIIIIFALATLINVLLGTIRSITTIKSNKWIAGLVNALSYGFYTWLVVLTVADFNLWVKVGITALANFIGVWLIKLVEEKARKDKMWKVEMAIPLELSNEVIEKLKGTGNWIPFNYHYLGNWCIFNCYCDTQDQTKFAKNLAKEFNGKISAYESKSLI